MKPNPIGRNPKILIVLAFAMIVGLNIYIVNHLQTLIENNRSLYRTLVIQARLNELLSLLIDSETAPRGYVIMGTEIFLSLIHI